MRAVLVLPEQLLSEVGLLACRGYPRECCGLLLGRVGDGMEHVVHRQHPGRNLAAADDRYELDPEDYLAADYAAISAGYRIVGVWHSHPNHPARPSITDRELAWSGWSYLIVSVDGGEVAELRSWRMHNGDFAEEEIEHA